MQLRTDVGKPICLKPDSEIVDTVAAMFLMIFMLIFALACAMGMAGMYSLMRIFRRELNLLHVQSEAWVRIHDQQGQLLQSVQEEKSCSCAEDTRTLWTHFIMGWRFVSNWGLWRMRTR